jgi:ATP-dependent RNA helicase MSS116
MLMALKQTGTKMPYIYNIHSRLSQNQRTAAADLFRGAKSAILVSSDVTARGMDFPNVSHVIQVFGPSSRDTYIHRLGRTGRQNKEGSGWLLVPESEIGEARKLLPGLPISPFTGLQIAKHNMSAASDQQPETVRRIHEAADVMGEELIDEAYTSFLGRIKQSRNNGLVEELNSWIVDGFGWKEAPAVSASLARRLGLDRMVRVRTAAESFARRNSFGGGDDRRGGDSYGRRDSFSGGDDRRGGDSFGRRSSFGGGDDRRGGGDRRGGQSFGSSFSGGRSGGGGFGGNARGGGRGGFSNRDRNPLDRMHDASSNTRSRGGRSSF